MISNQEMIERGAGNPTVLSLIRSGINLSVAIKAVKLIPQTIKTDPISWLLQNRFNQLSPIFQRHIIRQGF